MNLKMTPLKLKSEEKGEWNRENGLCEALIEESIFKCGAAEGEIYLGLDSGKILMEGARGEI